MFVKCVCLWEPNEGLKHIYEENKRHILMDGSQGHANNTWRDPKNYLFDRSMVSFLFVVNTGKERSAISFHTRRKAMVPYKAREVYTTIKVHIFSLCMSNYSPSLLDRPGGISILPYRGRGRGRERRWALFCRSFWTWPNCRIWMRMRMRIGIRIGIYV